MKNLMHNSNNNTMNYAEAIWVNHYDHYGRLSVSTPYRNFGEAIDHVLECVAVLNAHAKKDKYKYTRKGAFVWTAPYGAEIRVQDQGNLFLHIKDCWMLTTAYFDGKEGEWLYSLADEDSFLLWLFGVTGLNSDNLYNTAQQLLAERCGN